MGARLGPHGRPRGQPRGLRRWCDPRGGHAPRHPRDPSPVAARKRKPLHSPLLSSAHPLAIPPTDPRAVGSAPWSPAAGCSAPRRPRPRRARARLDGAGASTGGVLRRLVRRPSAAAARGRVPAVRAALRGRDLVGVHPRGRGMLPAVPRARRRRRCPGGAVRRGRRGGRGAACGVRVQRALQPQRGARLGLRYAAVRPCRARGGAPVRGGGRGGVRGGQHAGQHNRRLRVRGRRGARGAARHARTGGCRGAGRGDRGR